MSDDYEHGDEVERLRLIRETLVDLDSRRPHRLGFATCAECGHTQVSVIVATAQPDALECGRCGAMSCQFREDGGS